VVSETTLERAAKRCGMARIHRARFHASLGPGIPEPSAIEVAQSVGLEFPHGRRVVARPILGGLHHEYLYEPGRSCAELMDVRESSRRRSSDEVSGKDRAPRNQRFGYPGSERLGEQKALSVAATNVPQ
jgi:hypothetical protein